LIAMAGWGAGCATTGGTPPAVSSAPAGAQGREAEGGTEEVSAAVADKAEFYADWYDASAVVLPPPPSAGGRPPAGR
jgi:hypothetical protein